MAKLYLSDEEINERSVLNFRQLHSMPFCFKSRVIVLINRLLLSALENDRSFVN